MQLHDPVHVEWPALARQPYALNRELGAHFAFGLSVRKIVLPAANTAQGVAFRSCKRLSEEAAIHLLMERIKGRAKAAAVGDPDRRQLVVAALGRLQSLDAVEPGSVTASPVIQRALGEALAALAA